MYDLFHSGRLSSYCIERLGEYMYSTAYILIRTAFLLRDHPLHSIDYGRDRLTATRDSFPFLCLLTPFFALRLDSTVVDGSHGCMVLISFTHSLTLSRYIGNDQ